MEGNGSKPMRQNRVRELRENRLMTQAQLARKAKVALREEVAELATLIAARVLEREVSRSDHEKLISEAVERMGLEQEQEPPSPRQPE